VSGAGGAVALVVAGTTLQRDTPDVLRGRVVAAANACYQATQVAGSALGGLVVPVVGLAATLDGCSLAVLATALVAQRTSRP
jgi:hypothetical protein